MSRRRVWHFGMKVLTFWNTFLFAQSVWRIWARSYAYLNVKINTNYENLWHNRKAKASRCSNVNTLFWFVASLTFRFSKQSKIISFSICSLLLGFLVWRWISPQFPFKVEFSIFGLRPIGISLFPVTLRQQQQGGTVKQSWTGFLQTFTLFPLHLLFSTFQTTEIFSLSLKGIFVHICFWICLQLV